MLTGLVGLSVSAISDAARYDVQTLGPTLQSYSEHRMGLNVHHDVAWSEKQGGNFYARMTTGDSIPSTLDLHALATPASITAYRSYAEDINDARHVTGYVTDGPRETYSSAALWFWNTSTHSYQYIDLGSAAQTQIGGNAVETSSAYAISPYNSAFDRYYVAGFARQVAGGTDATPSQPVVWEVTGNGNVVGFRVLPLGVFSDGYGVAYGVTENGVVVGGAAPSGGYLSAVYWNSFTSGATIVPELSPGPGAGQAISSIANRARLLSVDGSTALVVVGHAFIAPSSPTGPMDVEGFIFRLGETGIDRSFSLGGPKTALMDVQSVPYAHSQSGVVHGLQPVGMSVNSLVDFENSALVTAATDGAFRIEAGVDCDTCDINDALPSANFDTVRHVLGINASGSLVGWRADGQAVRIQRREQSGDIQFFVRQTPALPNQPVSNYFWATYSHPILGSAAQNILLSSAAGCALLPASCADGTFDVSTSGQSFQLAPDTSRPGVSQRVDLPTIGGQRPSATFRWVQAVFGSGATCAPTSVFAIDDTMNPAGADPWGGFWCDRTAHAGAETNIRVNLDACGTGNCGTASAVANYACADRQCNNGVHGQNIHANRCLISGNCHWNNDRSGHSITFQRQNAGSNNYNSCTSISVATPCRRCVAGTNQSAWTSLGAPCCNTANPPRPILDPYDRIGNDWRNGEMRNCAEDKNSGTNRGSWWVDERNLSSSGKQWDDWQSYYQESRWSVDGACNLHSSSSEPQVLPRGHNSGNAGHVRRIRGHFTPGIDEHDWFGTVYDDSGNSATTPKPRGRLISHGQHPTENRKVRLQMCMYVDAIDGSRSNVDIKRLRVLQGMAMLSTSANTSSARAYRSIAGVDEIYQGTGGSTRRWLFDHSSGNQWTNFMIGGTRYFYDNHSLAASTNSPGHDARGPCFVTDDNGFLDFSISDYDNSRNNKEEAWVYYAVSLVDTGVGERSCDDLKYTLYYGNDRDSGGGFPSGGHGSGCPGCCNEGPW